MKILSAKQTREADNYTISSEPVSSIDLMERAAKGLAAELATRYSENTSFVIYCGKGNNGGDGLALGRLLCLKGCKVQLIIVEHSKSASEDFTQNLARLKNTAVKVSSINSIDQWITPAKAAVLVDGILGSGLSRPLEGLILDVVEKLNKVPNDKVAIDIPTGLFADNNSENDLKKVLKADYTLTFQSPKLAMMHKDTAPLCGFVKVIDIGLHPDFLASAVSKFHFVIKAEVKELFKPRAKFSYKGTYGHGLLLAGSKGSIGAAIMSAKAALRSGAGLLTASVPACGLIPLQTNLPEAMVIADDDEKKLTSHPDLKKFSAIAMGPGIGTDKATAGLLNRIIQNQHLPLVLDADALNILSENKDWLKLLPAGTILTPHPGEFKRLLGVGNLGSDYLERLPQFAVSNGVIVILKDSISTIAAPDGEIYFMDFGSPALASPGSGDVLTGVILGLLSSGYPPLKAAILGVYLQARAGTLSGENLSLESSLATDVIDCLALAFRELY